MDAIDKINIRLKTILRYVGYLKKYRGVTVEELEQNYEKRGARESILILGEEGVLPKEFAKEFSGVAGFRNILVDDLNNHLGDFEKYAKAVAKYLQ